MYKIFIIVFTIIASLTACSSLFNKSTAKTVLDVANIACIIANATSSDATIQQACGIVDDLLPSMREVLNSHRMAAAKYEAAKKCP